MVSRLLCFSMFVNVFYHPQQLPCWGKCSVENSNILIVVFDHKHSTQRHGKLIERLYFNQEVIVKTVSHVFSSKSDLFYSLNARLFVLFFV